MGIYSLNVMTCKVGYSKATIISTLFVKCVNKCVCNQRYNDNTTASWGMGLFYLFSTNMFTHMFFIKMLISN